MNAVQLLTHAFSDMYFALRGSTVLVHPTVTLYLSLSLPPSLSLALSLSHSQIQTLSVFFNLLFVFHSSSFMATRRVINRSYTAVYSVHLIGPYNSQTTLCRFCNAFYSFSFRPVPCCVFAPSLFASVLFICLDVVYLTTLSLPQRRMIGQN